MLKPCFTYVLATVLSLSLLSTLPAQTDPNGGKTGPLKVGTIDIVARTAQGQPGFLHLNGQVRMTSEDYDLAGEDVQVFSSQPVGGKPTLKKAVIEGNPATGQQVIAHIRQPLQGQAYNISADHALYTPDTSRPGGGKMDFTGHVKVIANSGFSGGTLSHAHRPCGYSDGAGRGLPAGFDRPCSYHCDARTVKSG